MFARPIRAEGESEAEFFDRVAPTRWDRYITETELRVMHAAQGYSTGPSTALDVGAGTGQWSQILQTYGWSLVCTEMDERSLAICQRRVPEASCVLVRAGDRTLPGEDASFGMLACVEVFHIIATAWFVSEASRLVMPGGLLVGVFANRRSGRGLYKHMQHRLRGSRGIDHYSTSYPVWKRALRAKGFEFLQEEGFCWLPFPRASDSSLIQPLVAMERLLRLNRIPDLSPWVAFVARKAT